MTNTVMVTLGVTLPVRYMNGLLFYKPREWKQCGKGFLPLISEGMQNCIKEKNPMYVSNVERLYSFWLPSMTWKNSCRREACEHCGKAFAYSRSLLTHGEEPCVCKSCGKTFVSSSRFQAHVDVTMKRAPMCVTIWQSFHLEQQLSKM
jgi:hypothetical protein